MRISGLNYTDLQSRIVRLLSLLVGVAVLTLSWSASRGAEVPDPLAVAKGNQFVRVPFANASLGNRILISFEGSMVRTDKAEGYHVLYVGPEEIAKLKEAGLEVIPSPLDEPGPLRLPGYPCYETVEEINLAAGVMVSTSPGLASLVDIGDSWEKATGQGGYDLQVLRLGNVQTQGPKPSLFLLCALHAREYATTPLCLAFAESLLDGYGSDADATWLLDHHEVHILLNGNPDGRKWAESGYFWRKNTNQNYCSPLSSDRGADLNRNFPFQWDCCGGGSDSECSPTYRGPIPESEPETQAIVDYMRSIFPDQRGPGLSAAAPADSTGIFIDVHAYGELVLWPWGFASSQAPNAIGLQTLGRKLAYWNQYTPEQSIGLYPVDGASDDFGYGDLGIAAFTLELGTTFFQSCSAFEQTIVPDNLPSLLYAAKAARTPYMSPAGPEVTALALDLEIAVAGQPVEILATLDDGLFNQVNGSEPIQAIAGAEYYVDAPPWAAGLAHLLTPVDGTFDSAAESVSGSIDTSGMSAGQHIVFVRGQDGSGNWGVVRAAFIEIEAPEEVPGLAWIGQVLLGGAVFLTGWWRALRSYNTRREHASGAVD
ncbi:MAG: M14 family zinc carboxypeptidase [Myxococcota bacterium]|nr:M14 family zinc carboxypeptidase [Myxococcota bacterium]